MKTCISSVKSKECNSIFGHENLISLKDFKKEEIEFILEEAGKLEDVAKSKEKSRELEGKILGLLFYEPSTRTRLSFETSMKRLGGDCIELGDASNSSVAKGESIADTAKMFEVRRSVLEKYLGKKAKVLCETSKDGFVHGYTEHYIEVRFADDGKVKPHEVPKEVIWAIAKVRQYGNAKYADPENWRSVELEKFHDALLRHILAAWNDPSAVDPESGLPHLSHAACNLAFILEDLYGKKV